MDGIIHQKFSFFHRELNQKYLIFAWVCGLLLGALVSVSADKILASTMRAAVSGSMSISGLLAVVLLPLLFSAFAVYISQPVLLVAVVFLKAFLFAYTGAAILILYPHAGWLIRCLLMFSDALTIPLLWWFWLSAVSVARAEVLYRSVVCLCVAALIGCVDMTLISPFLASLI